MKKAVALICIFTGLTGCFGNKPEEGLYPVIDVVNAVNNYQRIYCSDFFSSIELIPLETEDDCLLEIRHEPDIVCNHEFIFMRGARSLYAFDYSGNFLNQIGNKGQGPKEYILGSDAFLNREKPTIYIEDLQKIIEYDFSGNHIRSFKKDISQFSNYTHYRDDIFVASMHYKGKNKYKYCLLDMKGDIVKGFPNYIFFNREREFAATVETSLPPVWVDERLYLKDFVNDTIYALVNDELHPAYVFGFGKYTFPLEHLAEFRADPSLLSDAFRFTIGSGGFVGTPKYFFYRLGVPRTLPKPKEKPVYIQGLGRYISNGEVYGIYNIDQHTNILLDTEPYYSQKGIINDMNGGLSFVPRYYAGNNVVVDVWKAHEMKEMLTDEYFASQTIKDPQAHQKLKELLKKLTEDDNPVVVVAKLK